MKKFEYKTLVMGDLDYTIDFKDQNAKKLNQLGSEGWELVSVSPARQVRFTYDFVLIAFLKREIE